MTRFVRALGARGALIGQVAGAVAVLMSAWVALSAMIAADDVSPAMTVPLVLFAGLALAPMGGELALSRESELTLLRLRGMRPVRLVWRCLAEPLPVVLAAAAVGVGLGVLLVRLVGPGMAWGGTLWLGIVGLVGAASAALTAGMVAVLMDPLGRQVTAAPAETTPRVAGGGRSGGTAVDDRLRDVRRCRRQPTAPPVGGLGRADPDRTGRRGAADPAPASPGPPDGAAGRTRAVAPVVDASSAGETRSGGLARASAGHGRGAGRVRGERCGQHQRLGRGRRAGPERCCLPVRAGRQRGQRRRAHGAARSRGRASGRRCVAAAGIGGRRSGRMGGCHPIRACGRGRPRGHRRRREFRRRCRTWRPRPRRA